MKLWYSIREFFWPKLEPLTAEQEAAKAARDQQNDALIRSFTPKKQGAVALDEARRLSDVENERRRSADQKATTYLAFVAAILPLILTVTTAFWDKKAGNVPLWLNISLLVVAILYTLRAGKWAFEVLKVTASHRLGTSDFDKAWKQSEPTIHLTRSIQQTIRLNEAGTNEKVSGIKMTHAFLFRAFISFFLLLAVNILWPVVELIRPQKDPWLASSQTTLEAIHEIDKFNRTVIGNGTTRQSLTVWCAKHGLGQISVIKTKPINLPISTLPTLPKFQTNGHLPDAKASIRCGGHSIADAFVWFPPNGQPTNIDAMSLIHRGELREVGFVTSGWQTRSYWPHTGRAEGYLSLPPVLLSESFQVNLTDQKSVALVHVEYRKSILRFGPTFKHQD